MNESLTMDKRINPNSLKFIKLRNKKLDTYSRPGCRGDQSGGRQHFVLI